MILREPPPKRPFVPDAPPKSVIDWGREPNVYVRRARVHLGLRPTGRIYRREHLAMSPADQKVLVVVMQRAQMQPVVQEKPPLDFFALMTMGILGLIALLYGGGRKK